MTVQERLEPLWQASRCGAHKGRAPLVDIVRTCVLVCLCISQSCIRGDTSDLHRSPESRSERIHSFYDQFVIVLIDRKSEESLGTRPYDRGIYASAVDRATELGARSVALNLCFDKSGNSMGDLILADSIMQSHVILAAALDDQEKSPNELPARFRMSYSDTDGALPDLESANSGWIPLPFLLPAAVDIGFTNWESTTRIPLIMKYQGKYVKSLLICCLESAFRERAVIGPHAMFSLGDRSIALDSRGEAAVTYPMHDDLVYTSFNDLLDKHQDSFKNKVVVICYDGLSVPTINTSAGSIGVQRAFCYQLKSLYDELRNKRRVTRTHDIAPSD